MAAKPSGIAKLHLEDLSVGMKFTAGPYSVTQDAIIDFANEFDPQPFHTDPEAAKNTFFNGLAASGWHTAAITMRLLVQGGAPFDGGAIGLGGEISWPRPVRPGDSLTISTEIIEIVPSRSKPNQAIVTMRTVTENQDHQAVQILTTKTIVFKRGHAPGSLVGA